MTRSAGKPLLIGLTCAAAGLGGVVMPGASQARASRQRVFVANRGCAGRTFRPSQITLACGNGALWVTGLRYFSYGGANARARGRLHWVVCIPDCAQGRLRSVAARIRLGGRFRCRGVLYYGRAIVTRPRRNPNAGFRWNIRPFRC
jgi:hypothetical protein